MYFKSSNFSILDHTKDQFDVLQSIDTPVTCVALDNNNQVYYTTGNYVYKLGTTKKNKSQSNFTKMKIYGDLLIACDTAGTVKLFSKNILIRNYKAHDGRVNDIELYNGKVLISCGDDGNIKFFNIVEDKPYKVLDWFTDRIKCIKIHKNMLYAGLMNGLIYELSIDTFEIIGEHNVQMPISNVLIADDMLLFSSHNKVYNIKNVLRHLCIHTKYITCLALINNRIYTTSLDGFFKSWSLRGQCLSRTCVKSPILDFCIFESVAYFALEVGRVCKLGSVKVEEQEKTFVNRHLKEYESEIQYKILEQDIAKNDTVEKLIRKYEYKGALKEALLANEFKGTFSVLHFLTQQRKLKNALLFLDKQDLHLLLDFVIDNIHIKELFWIFYEIINICLSVYMDDIYTDEELFDKICMLSEYVDEECCFQEKAIELFSFIECFE